MGPFNVHFHASSYLQEAQLLPGLLGPSRVRTADARALEMESLGPKGRLLASLSPRSRTHRQLRVLTKSRGRNEVPSWTHCGHSRLGGNVPKAGVLGDQREAWRE